MTVSKRVTGTIIICAVFALTFCGSLSAGEDGSNKTLVGAGYNELIKSLAGKLDSPDECYGLILRRLIEGDFLDVEEALDLRGEDGKLLFGGYKFAMLRARCARVMFRLYVRKANPNGWPSEAQGAEMRRLARIVTSAYEEAFKLAGSDFERACVYARWHEMHAFEHSKFEADSLLLRSGSPLEMPEDSNKELVEKQAAILKRTVSDVELTPYPGLEEFINTFIEEYRLLARIGVPDKVFNELLEDVEEFLQKVIPRVAIANPSSMRPTIRYYIWYGLVGFRADEIENEYIDETMKTVEKYIREKSKELLPEYEEEITRICLDVIGIERGNRFVPRLKRANWPFEWSSIKKKVFKRVDSGIAGIVSDMRRSSGQERFASSAKTMASWVSFELHRYQRMQFSLHHAGAAIFGSGGNTHESGVWAYSTGRTYPIPPYPWEKIITLADAHTSGTKRAAKLVLKALVKNDIATLNTLITESQDFTKEDLAKLCEVINDKLDASVKEKMLDIKDASVERRRPLFAIGVPLPIEESGQRLVLVFRSEARGYWLAWGGIVDDEEKSLAGIITEVRPGLELPVKQKPVATVPASNIESVASLPEMGTLKPLDAGHGWQVRVGIGTDEKLSGLKFLYCRSEWTEKNKVPRSIPFKRYAGRHLGPVIWTFSVDGFRDKWASLNSSPSVLMTLTGDRCTYAASLPFEGFDMGYVQVYSAFDGRELARGRFNSGNSSEWPWGLFMSYKNGEPFGVRSDFEAVMPGMPAFRPIETLSANFEKAKDVSMKLSLDEGFFQMKADKRILPARGRRLLARWWVNDKPVMPTEVQEFAGYTGKQHLASILRLPAQLPSAGFNANQGDKISLQVMICPDRIESLWRNDAHAQNIVCLDCDDIPGNVVLSNRIDFTAEKEMLVKPNTKAPTAAEIKKLTDAIEKQSSKKVKKLLAANPQLVDAATGRSSYKPLGFLCHHRPERKNLLFIRIGGKATGSFWRKMTQVAGVLVDYGADVNHNSQNGQDTPLQRLVGYELHSLHSKDALPLELIKLLLERGADPEASDYKGTVLQQIVYETVTHKSERLVDAAEVLIENGADVFGVSGSRGREPVFEKVDSLKKIKDCKGLADAVSKQGEKRRKELEQAVSLGIEEFLSRIRYANKEELSSLNKDYPWEEGLDLMHMAVIFQRNLGASLEGVGSIEKLSLKGNWAEALLPTGREGENAYLHVVLMRYPGGGYHPVQARMRKEVKIGSIISNPEIHFDEIMKTVYALFEKSDMKGSN